MAAHQAKRHMFITLLRTHAQSDHLHRMRNYFLEPLYFDFSYLLKIHLEI